MPDQVLAVHKNVLKPRGTAVDAGDLVLTNQRLCFVQLAAWEPNVNANPLRTAIAGSLGGFGAAAVSTIASVSGQNPEIVKLVAAADKKRNILWGMNVDERLLKTKSRWVIPIEKVSFEKSSNGIGVSIKTKGIGALSQSNLTQFELYPTEGLESALQSILESWKSHQIAAKVVEGYASKLPAPQLFLDALKAGSSPITEWQESEMLGDNDYVGRLESVFKEQAYRDQCQIMRTLRSLSAGDIASLLQGQVIASQSEKLKKAIREEVSIWFGRIGVPLSIASFLAGVGFIVVASSAEHNSDKQNTALGSMSLCFIILFFSGLAALAWTVPFARAKTAKKRLQEQGVDPQKLESELRRERDIEKDGDIGFCKQCREMMKFDKEGFCSKCGTRPEKLTK
jgi:hypothetical protein